jgi:hypothetical protein
MKCLLSQGPCVTKAVPDGPRTRITITAATAAAEGDTLADIHDRVFVRAGFQFNDQRLSGSSLKNKLFMHQHPI